MGKKQGTNDNREKAELRELELLQKENNALLESSHWSSFFVVAGLVSLIPIYLFTTDIFLINVSEKKGFFLVSVIIVAILNAISYQNIARGVRYSFAKSGEVTEQIEALAEYMKRSEAKAILHDNITMQSIMFAYFSANASYLVSYLLGAFFFLRPYELPLHVNHLVSSGIAGLVTLFVSKIIV